MPFSNILPDPVNKITDAGVSSGSGSAGPGFASVTLRSLRDTQVSRTISGRGITRSHGSHMWDIEIQYNPLTRAEFEPVFSFLLSRNGRQYPFYVALPQYASPRDSAFATFVATNTPTAAATAAGSSSMIISHASIAGDPKPGDLFTINDSTNVNHTKAYRVTRSENSTVFETAGLTSTQRRIHFVPPLTRAVGPGALVVFKDPKIRCILKSDIQEYALNTENLYQFNLSLEEIQP